MAAAAVDLALVVVLVLVLAKRWHSGVDDGIVGRGDALPLSATAVAARRYLSDDPVGPMPAGCGYEMIEQDTDPEAPMPAGYGYEMMDDDDDGADGDVDHNG